MRRVTLLLLAALVLVCGFFLAARPANADPNFGLDPASPSLAVLPPGAAILNPVTSWPARGMQPPPAMVLSGAAMGLPAGATIDDFSYGDDVPMGLLALAYSVNRNAVGVPGSALAIEAMAPEGAVGADLYTPLGAPLPGPCGLPPMNPNALLVDGDGTTAGAAPLRLGLGLDELPPGPAFGGQDNISGLELENYMGSPVYFTVDAATAGMLGVSAADILAWFPGGPPAPIVWAPAGMLGLVPGDDIDALTVGDTTPADMTFTPGADRVFFSLKPGSPSLGALPHCLGGPASPGDVWSSAGGPAAPLADAEMLGLATVRSGLAAVDDNLDALDFVTASGGDADGDGMNNAIDFDDDSDMLSDSQEAALGTNPLMADTDGDGLTDGQEVLTYGTNPLLADTDYDGYSDGAEVGIGKNALVYCKIMRADINMDSKVNLLDLGAAAGWFGKTVPPAPARYDQGVPPRDNKINLLDLGAQASVFGQNVAACPAGVAMYWANFAGATPGAGTIGEANPDGTGAHTIVSGQSGPGGVAVDSSHIYWANLLTGRIYRANLDGTGVITLVSGQNEPVGVAVDSSHIYWANSNYSGLGVGAIVRANLDGTGVTTLVTNQINPTGVAVDSGHIYWANSGDGTINEANLDGTGVTTLVYGQSGPSGVAVDSSHIYWADIAAGTISEANLDGTGVTTLVTDQNQPVGVALYSGHIYWASSGAGTINEANLDGTGVTALVTGQDQPFGVAVGPQ